MNPRAGRAARTPDAFFLRQLFRHGFAQRIGDRFEQVHERLAIVDPGQPLIGHQFADAQMYFGSDAVVHFLEQQRKAQRHADMAGELEQAAVLPGEIDRSHRSLRLADQPGGEILPLRVDGALVPDGRRGGDAAGGKDDKAAAFHQMRLGFGARAQVGLQRLFGLGEIDGQQELLHLVGAQQNRIGEHAEILAHARYDLADDQSVEHAERVVGHDYERSALRPGGQRILVVDQLELELADRSRPETFAGHGVGFVLLVQPFEIGLAGDALDQPDEEPLEPRIGRIGVGEGVDFGGRFSHGDILSWRAWAGHPSGAQCHGPPWQVSYVNLRFSQSIMILLSSPGCSCWVQWPQSLISAFSRSGTKRSMPSAMAGDRTTSSSAITIRPGTRTFCSIVPLRSQLREKLRYQLMPPVKPVRVKVSTKYFISSSLSRGWPPPQPVSSASSALTRARLRCSAGSLAYSVAFMPDLRMKKRNALPTSLARAASAKPGFWK